MRVPAAFASTGAPSAPTNAVAAAANQSAAVSWNLSASNGGSLIDAYYADALDAKGKLVNFTKVACPCGNRASAVVGGLTNGLSYVFGVYAHNAAGFSTPDYTSSIIPRPFAGPAQGAVATAGDGAATMIWAPPVPNGGAAISLYAVVVYDNANPPNYTGHSVVVCATCYSATVTGLTNARTYNLYVAAGNSAGYGPAVESGPVTANADVPAAPTFATAFVPGSASIGVYWYPSQYAGTTAVSSYAVHAYDLAVGLVSTAFVTCSPCSAEMFTAVTGLAEGHSYFFAIDGANAAGYGPPALTAVSRPNPATPGPPINVAATSGNTFVVATWVPPAAGGTSTVSGYLVGAVDRTTDALVTATVNCPCANPVTVAVTGLANGRSYLLGVYAINGSGPGPPGVSNVVAPGAQAPAAPTNVAASAGNATAAISWTASTTNGAAVTSYTVTPNPGDVAAVTTNNTGNATINGLVNGTSYTFTVSASSAAGPSSASVPSNAVIPYTPLTLDGPYATEYWPGYPSSAFTSLEIPMNVSHDPMASPSQVPPAYFWSTQFYPVGICDCSNGDGGYFGIQKDADGERILISWWSALSSSSTNPAAIASAFTGAEGFGSRIQLPFAFVEGASYRLVLALESVGVSTTTWHATVQDVSASTVTEVGSLVVPNSWGSALEGVSISWTEYYGPPVRSCAQLPMATTVFGPLLLGGTMASGAPYISYGSGGCPTSQLLTGLGGFSQTVGG